MSQRRRALNTSFSGLLLGLVCIGIWGVYIKHINHCQALMIKKYIIFKELEVLILSQGQIDGVTQKGHTTLGNKLILCLRSKLT